ncbi:MAG: HD-GYP domain-containing protein [Lachnospiraceae bacterium]|nr:HD-GYP domain-containing protein [Lachnospiraceae bacterium]
MRKGRSIDFINMAENVIHIAAGFILTIVIIVMTIAIYDKNQGDEATMGNFGTIGFNGNWTMYGKGGSERVNLPLTVPDSYGDEVTLLKRLPSNLSDGMSFMIRSTVEDVSIYVDGKLRTEYTALNKPHMSRYLPSAFIVADLNAADAGKNIVVIVHFNTKHVINDIQLSHGNNVWFGIIKNSFWVNCFAFFVLIMGILLFTSTSFLESKYKLSAIRILGLLMINVTLWMLAESTLRQFIFQRPTLSQYFSYFLVELIGAFACMYFDEVQHRVYHKRYVVMEGIVVLQIFVNIILHATNVIELYGTMYISHIWNMLCAVLGVVNLITDAVKGRIRNYKFAVIGMVSFIVLALGEMIGFMANRFHVFGAEICIALFLLMTATIAQTIYDSVTGYEERAKNYTAMTVKTIETIASAIDARDEYTGGHSERVGCYAERLAREMAADYELSEDDIQNIHYVGLIHDIGKIGVPDGVLNKSGMLDDEEFALMKQHPVIGYEIMSSLGGNVEGLLDGIRYHHERFDGTGYPEGLSDTDIPLIARILAIADSYDAMTTDRVYRMRLSDEVVKQELIRCAGTQFDPALVAIFLRLLENGEVAPITSK